MIEHKYNVLIVDNDTMQVEGITNKLLSAIYRQNHSNNDDMVLYNIIDMMETAKHTPQDKTTSEEINKEIKALVEARTICKIINYDYEFIGEYTDLSEKGIKNYQELNTTKLSYVEQAKLFFDREFFPLFDKVNWPQLRYQYYKNTAKAQDKAIRKYLKKDKKYSLLSSPLFVILDLNMPKNSGFELLSYLSKKQAEIKEKHKETFSRGIADVIIHSNCADPLYVYRGLFDFGAEAYIYKEDVLVNGKFPIQSPYKLKVKVDNASPYLGNFSLIDVFNEICMFDTRRTKGLMSKTIYKRYDLLKNSKNSMVKKANVNLLNNMQTVVKKWKDENDHMANSGKKYDLISLLENIVDKIKLEKENTESNHREYIRKSLRILAHHEYTRIIRLVEILLSNQPPL